jgi:hypothetical protein
MTPVSLPLLTSALSVAAPYIALFACLLSVILFVMLLALRRRFIRLALGRNGSIEESVSILSRDTKELQQFRRELEQYLKVAEKRIEHSVQGVGIVRFNPFQGDGSGGNQSFSLALIDERLSGVVFSTIYARDRVGVYAKPVEKGTSTFELTQEEHEAIDRAKKSLVPGAVQPART